MVTSFLWSKKKPKSGHRDEIWPLRCHPGEQSNVPSGILAHSWFYMMGVNILWLQQNLFNPIPKASKQQIIPTGGKSHKNGPRDDRAKGSLGRQMMSSDVSPWGILEQRIKGQQVKSREMGISTDEDECIIQPAVLCGGKGKGLPAFFLPLSSNLFCLLGWSWKSVQLMNIEGKTALSGRTK